MSVAIMSLEDLVQQVPDGALLAVPPDYSGCAMAAVRALIRRGVRDLHLLGVPQMGLPADLLIGAGCVARVESAAVTLGEQGLAPRFTEAVKSGGIEIRDSTCPAIHAGLQAAEKGVPFMPLRGILGSDLLEHRADWRVIDNPFGEADPIVLLPSIQPDVALFHAPLADRDGNVWIGVRRELLTLAHAAKQSFVTVEAVTDESLLADDKTAAGTIPAIYVSAIAEAETGAWPLGLRGSYAADDEHLALYAREAKTKDRFARYLETYVLGREAAE